MNDWKRGYRYWLEDIYILPHILWLHQGRRIRKYALFRVVFGFYHIAVLNLPSIDTLKSHSLEP